MASTLQIMGFLSEGLGTLAAIIMATLVLRKDPSYVGNRLMAAASIGIGGYMGFILWYDLFPSPLSVQVLLRLALISILFGTLFLYFTMQVMVHSSAWLDNKMNIIPGIVYMTALSTAIVFLRFITIVDLEVVNTQIDMLPLAIIIASTLLFLLITAFDLYYHGIRHVQGQQRKNMMTFFIGLLTAIGSIILTIIANILEDQAIGAVFDVLFFSTLAVAIVLMAIGFGGKSSSNK